MATNISALVAKLKRENPELRDSATLDQIEQAAGGSDLDDEPMDDGMMSEPGDAPDMGGDEFDLDLDAEMAEEGQAAKPKQPKARKGMFR